MIGIYKITFDSGEFYIGKTSNFEKRKAQHISTQGLGSPRLQKAFINQKDPKIELIEVCNTSELDELEKTYIAELQPPLNVLPGGETLSGLNHPRAKYTKEQLEKVLELFLFTEYNYTEIANKTNVNTATVHDILKGRSHTWLTEGVPEHLLKDAKDRRDIVTLYSPNGTEYKVKNITEFEEAHNLPKGMITKMSKNNRYFNALGWSKVKPRKTKITTPEGESFECTEPEAYIYLQELPSASKTLLFKKQRPSLGYSLRFLD